MATEENADAVEAKKVEKDNAIRAVLRLAIILN